MTHIDTAPSSGVIRHDDGRIAIYRGLLRPAATFFHIELTPPEIEALRTLLSETS